MLLRNTMFALATVGSVLCWTAVFQQQQQQAARRQVAGERSTAQHVPQQTAIAQDAERAVCSKKTAR
jgi:hypothetical protein